MQMTSREVNKYRFFCNTEQQYKYVWDEVLPSACPTDAVHSIDLASLTIVDNVSETATRVRGAMLGSNYDASVTSEGKLLVDVPTSAFGLLKVQEETPDVQIMFTYGIPSLACTSTVTGVGTVTSANSLAFISSGAAVNSSARLVSNRVLKYAAGQGGNIMFTAIFDPPAIGNKRIIGSGTDRDGFFFGYNGLDFGILRRADNVDTWTLRASWNIDKMDGTGPSRQTIDLSRGNVYRINFQWLGFGAINFFIEESTTGRFLLVHRIAFANQNTLPSVADPSMPMFIESVNTTNNTNLEIHTACYAAMLEGTRRILTYPFGDENTKTVTVAAGQLAQINNVLTIRNKSIFQGVPHYIPVYLNSIHICSTGTQAAGKTAIISLIRGGTLGGTVTWVDSNTQNSVVEYNTTGTTVTGGIQMATFPIHINASTSFDLRPYNIHIEPGQTVSAGFRLTAAGTNEVTIGLCWTEDR